MESNVQVLGISVDHIPSLQAWAKSLDGITYPLLSDFWPHGYVAEKYGVFREAEGKSERAIFIIDKDGIIQYIDIHEIEDQPDNEVLFAELKRIDPQGAAVAAAKEKPPEALPSGGIVMYCNNWCPSCRRARVWLEENEIEYTEVDVNKNKAAATQVREWADGNLVTPTFDVNGTVVVNFELEKLEKLLLK